MGGVVRNGPPPGPRPESPPPPPPPPLPTDMEVRAVQAAAQAIVGSILDLLQDDPHQWSTRPCPTCRSISKLVGRPFGCYKYAAERKR